MTKEEFISRLRWVDGPLEECQIQEHYTWKGIYRPVAILWNTGNVGIIGQFHESWKYLVENKKFVKRHAFLWDEDENQ